MSDDWQTFYMGMFAGGLIVIVVSLLTGFWSL